MITNKDLKRCCKQVFTYSAQYQAPFFGREKSIAEMQEKTASLKNGEVLVISQPLGTGKTFLVNHMIAEGKIDAPRGVSFLFGKGIADSPENMRYFPGKYLIIDEMDIKTSYNKLVMGLKNLQQLLDDTEKRAIVIGDFALRDRQLQECLKSSKMLLNFEPMDKDFLCGVLNQRFEYFMEEYIGVDFTLDSVIDPQLMQYLTPEWMKSANSFRGIFSLLQEIVNNDKYVRYNGDKAYLELSMFRDYLTDENSLELDEEVQYEFLQVLREYIGSEYSGGSGITRGFNTDELYALAESAGIDIEYDDFTEDILYPLAVAGLLVSVGVPTYANGTFIRRPAPFVPSLKLLLSVS